MPPRNRRSNFVVEKPKNKHKNSNTKKVIALVSIIILILALVAGGGLFAVKKVFGASHNAKTFELQTRVVDEEGKVVSSGNSDEGPIDGATDYLLVGADSRVDMQGNPLSAEEAERLKVGSVDTTNTDVIMVMRVSEKTGAARIISIPRDTYITDRQYGNTKINAVYGMHQRAALDSSGSQDPDAQQRASDAGRQGLSEAVANLTGVTIDHYVEIGLVGFALFTDAVGGVDVCLNQATSDEMTGASFQAGPQTLDGAQALSFVRQRHGLARGDLDRVVRQQAYISAMISKLSSTGTLTNPSKLKEIVNAVERSVAVDSSLDLSSAAGTLSKLNTDDIKFDTIPVEDMDGTGDNGESVVSVDVNSVQRFFSSLLPRPVPNSDSSESTEKNDKGDSPDLPKDISAVEAVTSARVYASGNNYPEAERVAQLLRNEGIVVTDTAMAPDSLRGSNAQVLVRQTSDAAKKVGEVTGLPVNTSSVIPSGMIVVLVDAPVAGQEVNQQPEVAENLPNAAGPAPEGSGAGLGVESNGAPCVN